MYKLLEKEVSLLHTSQSKTPGSLPQRDEVSMKVDRIMESPNQTIFEDRIRELKTNDTDNEKVLKEVISRISQTFYSATTSEERGPVFRRLTFAHSAAALHRSWLMLESMNLMYRSKIKLGQTHEEILKSAEQDISFVADTLTREVRQMDLFERYASQLKMEKHPVALEVIKRIKKILEDTTVTWDRSDKQRLQIFKMYFPD